MIRRTLAIAVLATAFFAHRAEAACTISTTSVSFGTYNVFNATADTSTGTVTYRCGNSDHNIEITLSAGSSGSFTTRTLQKGTEVLNYNLYINAALTTIWGDGSGATNAYTKNNPPNGQDTNVTVYGSIPAQQDVSVGDYADTVVVTILF